MPTAKQQNLQGELFCSMGPSGKGKSTLAMQSPQPQACLLVDKPVIAPLPSWLPGYDPAQTFFVTYPSPDVDLTDAKAKRDRSVFDQILADLQTLKVALHKGEPTFKMRGEEWPLPRTIIIEGGDFVRKHACNWILHNHNKHDMDEFDNPLKAWGLVGDKMLEFYNSLTFLPGIRPVNVVVTIGLDEETKMMRNERGKMEMVKTGQVDPAFGGKLDIEGPRKFRDCWLAEATNKKWFVVTTPNAGTSYEKFRGLRSGRFGLKPVEDVTLDPEKPVNQWNRLFGGV